MNGLEFKMVDILKDLKERHGAVSVRAEFEAEGTKLEEVLRLKEICANAGLGLNLKIGGCESVRDMLEVRAIGVDHLVAPMIESAYALQKYLQAVSGIFSKEELRAIKIICNIETIAAVNNFDEMLQIPQIALLSGIVVGRVNLCYSLGMSEKEINDKKICEISAGVIKKAKSKRLACGISGGVSMHSLPFFSKLPEGSLDHYQTRKVCFDCQAALKNDPEAGIIKALAFESLWIENKLNYFIRISEVDKQRMDMIKNIYLSARP